jgi:hypothetical protein
MTTGEASAAAVELDLGRAGTPPLASSKYNAVGDSHTTSSGVSQSKERHGAARFVLAF